MNRQRRGSSHHDQHHRRSRSLQTSPRRRHARKEQLPRAFLNGESNYSTSDSDSESQYSLSSSSSGSDSSRTPSPISKRPRRRSCHRSGRRSSHRKAYIPAARLDTRLSVHVDKKLKKQLCGFGQAAS
jgi:hypothetical protein